MKHKKLFCLSLASVFAMSLVGFAACGNDEGGNDNDGPGGNTDEDFKPDRTATAFSDPEATFTLDGTSNTNAGNTISDSLFGVFLEDINYAGYLLADNLVYNGSFESFSGKTGGWTATGATIASASEGGVLANEQYYGAKGVNANYANVTVTAANGSISNGGHAYVPIAVEKDVKYIFSAFLKTAAATTMTVRVTDGNTTYCEAGINVLGGNEWVKYEQTLTANASASENVKLELSFANAGTYSIDGVSLETQHATGGIKQYAFDAIKELGPKFVRFPGGCIIEGDGGNGGADTQEVYDWKNSIGAVQTGNAAGDDDIPAFAYKLVKDGAAATTATTYGEWVTRRQNADLWGYDMEYGVGFYEYFLLCENIGASAIPIVNCGLSCQGGGASNPTKLNGRHGQKVNDYIQDAIDLLEFAKGDKTTTWGAIRAKLGHPEPFKMDYIGIGNEQSGDNYYKDCYEEFLKSTAFQDTLAEYGVKTIVGNAMHLSDCEQYSADGTQQKKGVAQTAAEFAVKNNVVDAVKTVSDYGVVDQHYYVNYRTFLENTGRYDYYQRPDDSPDGYYEVFVGEYSANSGDNDADDTKYPNALITALSEAAMMTGFERNGDIVKLAAYAPMFSIADQRSNATIGGLKRPDIQWPVDMMYSTNTNIVRTANYYVQQLFMQNQGKYKLYRANLQSSLKFTDSASAKCTLFTESGSTFTADRVYYIASKAENGDLILKIVNFGDALKLNIDITKAEPKGYAYVTEVYAEGAASTRDALLSLNTVAGESVSPHEETVGFTGTSLGQELKPCSVTVLRFPAN